MAQPTVTTADLLQGLRALGLESGDALLVHTSMKSFGHVEGGPEAVIDALLEAVGPRGCVVVPTLTLGRSEAPVVFDVRHTPGHTGLLTETLRQRPGACRSLHPTESAAALGFAAEEITRHPGETPCGLTSPFGQVYLRGGKSLFLGAPWTTNTMFHVAEEIVMPAYLRMAEFRDATVIDAEGVARRVAFKRYNCYQSGVKRDLAALEKHFVAAGVVRETRIGAATCRVIRARDNVDICVDILTNHLEEILSYAG